MRIRSNFSAHPLTISCARNRGFYAQQFFLPAHVFALLLRMKFFFLRIRF